MANFSRSSFMKQRHQLAKQRKQLAKKFDIDKNYEYSDYLKKDNPVDKKIKMYQVSYQATYRTDEGDEIHIEPQTFYVYAVENGYTQEQIYQKTKTMVADLKGQSTGSDLAPQTKKAIYQSVEPQIEPRGLEKVSDYKREEINKSEVYNRLMSGDIYVDSLDSPNTQLQVKDSKSGKVKRSSQVNLDIRHFF